MGEGFSRHSIFSGVITCCLQMFLFFYFPHVKLRFTFHSPDFSAEKCSKNNIPSYTWYFAARKLDTGRIYEICSCVKNAAEKMTGSCIQAVRQESPLNISFFEKTAVKRKMARLWIFYIIIHVFMSMIPHRAGLLLFTACNDDVDDDDDDDAIIVSPYNGLPYNFSDGLAHLISHHVIFLRIYPS